MLTIGPIGVYKRWSHLANAAGLTVEEFFEQFGLPSPVVDFDSFCRFQDLVCSMFQGPRESD
jgi:hypothetical protein